jgi:hypothetical protein
MLLPGDREHPWTLFFGGARAASWDHNSIGKSSDLSKMLIDE